jgi:hypothetical protein
MKVTYVTQHDLEGYVIGATVGTLGHVKDFHFDDEAWAIRYLDVDTGAWLSSRKVLISPFAAEFPLIGPTRFPGMGTT